MAAKKRTPQIKTLRLAQMRPAEYNPREIDDEALAGLAASMKKFGCVEPIVVNIRGGRNTIIGGHQRFKVLQQLKAKQAQVIIVDLSEKDEKALNISLNNPAIQGRFIAELDEYLAKLKEEINQNDLFDLQIEKLHQEIGGKKLIYKEEELKPFQKTHILLSFPPELLSEILEPLNHILKIDGIDYEQASN